MGLRRDLKNDGTTGYTCSIPLIHPAVVQHKTAIHTRRRGLHGASAEGVALVLQRKSHCIGPSDGKAHRY